MNFRTFRRLLTFEQARLGVITEEKDLIKLLSESLPYLENCYIARQEAVHRSGIPDFIICYRGFFIGIEAKDNTGKQSKLQKEKEIKITGAGGIYVLAAEVAPIIKAMEVVNDKAAVLEEALEAVR